MGLNLRGTVSLDGSGFERGLHRLESAGQHAFGGLKQLAVAAFGLYGVEQAIEKTMEAASSLVDESQRLDIPIEQLQVLRQAAKNAGAEMGSLVGVFEKINLAREKALHGDKDTMKAFGAFGITKTMLKTQRADQLFTGPIAAKVGSSNVADISTELKQILGKGFGEAVPVLKTDFADLQNQMQNLGTIMDTNTAVKLDALGDEFSLLSQIVVTQLGPAILQCAELIVTAIGKLKGMGQFWGDATSKLRAGDIMNANPALKYVTSLLTGRKLKDDVTDLRDFWKRVGETLSPHNLIEAALDGMNVEASFQKGVDELRAQLSAQADRLKKPPPFLPGDGSDKKGKGVRPGDELVRVGNFLGSSGPAGTNHAAQIVRLNEKHVDIAQKQLIELGKIYTQLAAMSLGTIFPP
jgi:hypothetical protein